MARKIENVVSVIAIILLIIGVITSFPAFVERNFLILALDFVLVVIGVILLAATFDK